MRREIGWEKAGLEKEIGVVLPPVQAAEVRILLLEPERYEGEGLQGRLFRIALPQRGYLAVQAIDHEVVNDLGSHLGLAAGIGRMEEGSQVGSLLAQETFLVLRARVLSAFRRGGRGWERIYPLPVVLPFAKVYPLEEAWLENLMPLRGNGGRFFSLGRYYGSEVAHRLHLQDFNSMDEAYHFAVVGLPGSGKSTLVKMLLAAYAAVEPMNFLIADTVGEFAAAFEGKDRNKPGLQVPLGDIFRALGRPYRVVGIENLRLSTWELVEELMVENKVFRHLGLRRTENQRLAAEYLTRRLQNTLNLDDLYTSGVAAAQAILNEQGFADYVYKGDQNRQQLRNAVQSPPQEFWRELREEVFAHYDTQKESIRSLVRWVLEPGIKEKPLGHTLVLNLGGLEWGAVKYLLLHQLFSTLEREAMESYREHGRAKANTLAVVEEAHRMVPPKEWVAEGSHEEKVRNTLRRAVTETRKAGLGWLFISTRISNLDRTVFEETRVRIVGRGLTVGTDAERIREALGSETLAAYRELPDPVDPLRLDREHVFLVSGPINVLSRSAAEIISVYGSYEEFSWSNALPSFRKSAPLPSQEEPPLPF